MQNVVNLFVYGILAYPEVIATIIKKDYSSIDATLNNYVRKQVKNAWYPGITMEEGSSVKGKLYLSVS